MTFSLNDEINPPDGVLMPLSFTALLDATGRTNKESGHGYGHIYDALLAPYRGRAASVLEIGVCTFGGGSVLALAEYFPEGDIYGLDNNWGPCCAAVKEHPRIKSIEADAFNPGTPAIFSDTRFDIIIEDVAPHETADQVVLHRLYGPLLKPGGLYVIEDCSTREWLDRLPDVWRAGWKQSIIDMSRYDFEKNSLVVLERT